MLQNYLSVKFTLSFLCLLLFFTGELLAQELETVYNRRVANIISANNNPQRSDQWRNELTAEGIWKDVDYTSGCPARRANWPAQDHLHRIITMASVWSQNQSDVDLLSKISLALDWWNDRDYTEDDCVNAGGNAKLNCPCGTPGMWNTNWYDQMILIPGLFASACLVLKSKLTATQLQNCTTQMYRAYDRIDGDPNGSMGAMTGANMLDVSSTGVSLGLLSNNAFSVREAVDRYYNEAQVTTGGVDGIKIDGSFMQHSSQLYNGNYGAVFMRAMLKIFLETKGTSLTPPESVRSAYLTVINGSEWLIYRKSGSDQKLSWQYSAIGRMVSHKYEDWSGIGLELDEILAATDAWENAAAFKAIVSRLKSGTGVNPGGLIGTRFFHTSDMMVHRGANFIVTLKMYSTRTTNSECNNGQNPFGFHLSDGVIYTHLTGHEYTNVYGAWDWNLIPGSTVNYGATPLGCGSIQHKGKESYVGGVALDNAGIGVMKYTNPQTASLRWHKVFFFFPNSYIVQFVGDAVSAGNASVPVYTTLDQRQLTGDIYMDGEKVSTVFTRNLTRRLWHDRVGYEFQHPLNLTVDTRPRQSNWAAIGISQGNETQTHFTAFFENPQREYPDDWFTYIAYLDIDRMDFEKLAKKHMGILMKQSVKKNSPKAFANVRGAFYRGRGGEFLLGLAFVTPGEYFTGLEEIPQVVSDSPILLMFQRKISEQGWRIAVADPGRTLTKVNVTVFLTSVPVPIKLEVTLPTGALAGSTAVVEF